MKQENLRLKKGDFLAFFAVLALAAAIFAGFTLSLGNRRGERVRVYQNGTLLWEQPLGQDGSYEISGEYTNVVTISGGKVSITASDCPGEDCVRQGAISTAGRSIVCLPNRVEVRVTGQDSGAYDIAVG